LLAQREDHQSTQHMLGWHALVLSSLALLSVTREVDAHQITEVRLGCLFPHQPRKFGRFAAVVMAVQEINSSPELLRGITLRLAARDSACDAVYALYGAHQLAESSFSGSGVDAIIGAACSSASIAAADFLKLDHIPLVSPSSTSAALSDGVAYPYFARTAPSDAWQSFALADLVEHLLGVQRVATVNSEDSYGSVGMLEFLREAERRNLNVRSSTTFANGQVDFSSNVKALQKSTALVVVLFCQAADAKRFIKAVQTTLQNITYVGSESVTSAVSSMITNSKQEAGR
jgi:ABC-type branched-subunit amino acid transport system substrate-binding protein